MKLNVLAASVAAATSLVFAGAAQAGPLLIDDFQFTVSAEVVDRTVDGVGVTNPTRGTGGTTGAGITRDSLFVNLTAGTGAVLRDCTICQAGTFSNEVTSASNGSWSWTATNLDLSGYSSASFDYVLDLSGADFILRFFDSADAELGFAQAQDLAATDGAFKSFSLDLTTIASALVGVNGIRVDVILDRENQDFEFRNLNLNQVPEPGSLALVGLSLAALGFVRRRRT